MSYLRRGAIHSAIILLGFLFANALHSQTSYHPGNPVGIAGNITVYGSVYDSASNVPVEYANVVLLTLKDSLLVNGTITDTKGRFSIQKVLPGKYKLKVSFIGYKTYRRILYLQPGTSSFNAEIIYIESSVSNLNEVTIKGEKPLIEYKLDKKVINVEKNINTSGGTAVDVLQNVPGVTVDIDGNVNIRGSSNITILIDGRPSSLDGTKLNQISASSIDNIELITNPSAKYNPEGMSGIINIRLKKKRNLGLNGIASVNAGTGNKYTGSLNLNYSFNSFNFFGSYDYRYNQRKGWDDANRTTYVNDTPSYLVQHVDRMNKSVSNNVKLGFDYQINKKNAVTLSWLNNNSNSNGTEFSKNRIYNYLDTFTTYFETNNKESDLDQSNDFTLNYRKTFSRKKEELTIDAVYSISDGRPGDDTKTQYFTTNYIPANDTPAILNAVTNSHNNRLTIQGNYVYPLKGEDKIEAGFQSISRNNDNDYTYHFFDYKHSLFEIDTSQSNRFIYTENINAVYGTLSKVYSKFSYQIGLRLEEASTLGDSKSLNKKYSNNYFSLFPTIHFTRKFEKSKQDIQFSYSRRINRPDVWSINPYVDRSNPLMVRYGNPGLKPEYINSFEFGHSKSWAKASLYSDIFYRQINHVIKRYVFLDSNSILNMTSENLSSGISYGVEFVFDSKVTKWCKSTLNFSYFRTKINGDVNNTELTNENYSWTSSLNTNFILSKTTGIQLNGNYNGPMVTPQGEMKQVFFMDVAAKKDFLGERATITFRLSDIFNTRKWASTSSGEGFTGTNTRKRESRVFYVGLIYKINGGVKQQSRKKSLDNNNGGQDDRENY